MAELETVEPLKLDIGCGKNKKPGFVGVDQYAFDGVDVVLNLSGNDPWPWENGSVQEVNCSHFLEHLTAPQRVQFLNNLHRVMAPGAKALIVTPHWGSNRAYGDPTHQWPPVSEMAFYYLDKTWRQAQAPHTDSESNPQGYSCDFTATWGYSLHPQVAVKHTDAQQFAMSFYKEAVQDMHATLVKK